MGLRGKICAGNKINKNREAFTSWRKERTLSPYHGLYNPAGPTVPQKVNSGGESRRTDGRDPAPDPRPKSQRKTL